MKVLLIILLVLILIGMIPVGVLASYSAEGPLVQLRLGPFSVGIIPKKVRNKKKGGKKKEKKQKKQKAEDSNEESPKSEKKSSGGIGGLLPLFQELLPLALDAVGHVFRKLKLRHLKLHLSMGVKSQDPAKASILYGGAWALLGQIIPTIEKIFVVKDADYQANIDYLSDETTIMAMGQLTMTIGEILWIGFYYGVAALLKFLKFRKNRKGGQ